MIEKPQMPRSTAMGEAIGASTGMVLGMLLGAWMVSVAGPFGSIGIAIAAILAVALFAVFMVGGSVLGNWLWSLSP